MPRIHRLIKRLVREVAVLIFFLTQLLIVTYFIYHWCNLSLSLAVYFIDNIISELRRSIIFICLCEMKHVLRSSRVIRTSDCQCQSSNSSIPASSDTVEIEGWQMKQCWIKYIKKILLLRFKLPLCLLSSEDIISEDRLLWSNLHILQYVSVQYLYQPQLVTQDNIRF